MNYIELSGKSYPIQFGYGALMEYEALTGRSALSILEGENVRVTDILSLIACGLTNGADAAGTPEHYTAKAVGLLLDGTPNSPLVFQRAMELLRAAFAVEDGPKKKAVPPHANREMRRKAA